MCDSVLVNGVVCVTVGELREHAHIDKLCLCMKVRNIHDASCLCTIDIRKTAQKNGYTAELDYDALVTWKLEKMDENEPAINGPFATTGELAKEFGATDAEAAQIEIRVSFLVNGLK